jgi:hypothetical protein
MQNLVLITSIINIPTNPFSYSSVRSIYTREQRFTQTKHTIQTVKEKIPNCQILIVECSQLNEEENTYLKENTDYQLNLIDNPELVNRIYSLSKSMGEGTITIEAIKYIKNRNIQYDNFFKISGRYWLNENFQYSNYENRDIIALNECNNTVTNTSLFKLPNHIVELWMHYLQNSENEFKQCIGIEQIFATFLNQLTDGSNIFYKGILGISGLIAVDGYELHK